MTFEPSLKQTTSQGQKYPLVIMLGWGHGGGVDLHQTTAIKVFKMFLFISM